VLVCRDAFTKREKANEDYSIRQREKEKLLELKKKLAEQHEHLKKLEEHMYDLLSSSEQACVFCGAIGSLD